MAVPHPLCPLSPDSTHTGAFISHIALGARRSFWPWEASVTLEQMKWHHQPLQTTPLPSTAAGGSQVWWPAQVDAQLCCPSSPAHDHAPRGASMGPGGTARAGLPSLLQHQPRWEPGGEAEVTMLGAAHRSLSHGWGRERWTHRGHHLPACRAVPDHPAERETGVIAGPLLGSLPPAHQHPASPSPSPRGGRPVLELPVARGDLRGLQCLGMHTRGMATPCSWSAGSAAQWPLPRLTSLPDGPGRPGAPASPCRREGRGRCQGHPPTPCQGSCSRAGHASPWVGHCHPSPPTFSPSGPGTPRSPCRAKQRRVSRSLPPSTPQYTLPQSPLEPSPESHPRPLGSDSNPCAQPPWGCRDTRTH